MWGRVLGVCVIAIGVLAATISANVQRDISQSNDFIAVFPLELIGVLLGGVVGVIASRTQQNSAAGVYLVIVAAGIGTLFPIWLPEDDTILGSAVLAGEMAGVGTALTVAATERSLGLATAGGVLAFLLVTAGGIVSPLAQLHVPIMVALLVTAYALLRNRAIASLPLVITAVIVTIGVLVLRGPDDWASASHSLKLYSLPVVLLALGFSLLISPLRQTGSVAPRESR